MVKLRLTRTGHKNYATYRVVATDAARKRESLALEILGHYLPHEKKFEVNKERVEYWLSVGAQPSSTVAFLLAKNGFKNIELPKKVYHAKPGKKALERAKKAASKAAAVEAEAAQPVEEVVAEAPAEETAAE